MSTFRTMFITHNAVEERPPSFKGSHLIRFVGGEEVFVQLEGAMYKADGEPVYVFMKGGAVFNWSTITQIVKVTPKSQKEIVDAPRF